MAHFKSSSAVNEICLKVDRNLLGDNGGTARFGGKLEKLRCDLATSQRTRGKVKCKRYVLLVRRKRYGGMHGVIGSSLAGVVCCWQQTKLAYKDWAV